MGNSINLAVYTKPVSNPLLKATEEFVTKPKLDKKQKTILLRSNKLIDANIGKKLTESIQSLQENENNFRSSDSKSQLQEIIPQFQYFNEYKELKKIVSDERVPISIAPAIYSLKKCKFLTEINGLEYNSNIKLYELIETIVPKFIPLFQHIVDKKIFKEYENISLIVKIQDYIFKKYADKVLGGWHCEGNDSDNIIAVGLYYFNITENKYVKFQKVSLDVAKQECDMNDILKVDIKENDCIVFKNDQNIKHRTHIEPQTFITDNKEYESISRKLLSFFLIAPEHGLNPNDYKWINFPLKTKIFIQSFLKYDMEFIHKISNDIIDLVAVHAFGDDKYQREMITQFRKIQGSDDEGKGLPFPIIVDNVRECWQHSLTPIDVFRLL